MWPSQYSRSVKADFPPGREAVRPKKGKDHRQNSKGYRIQRSEARWDLTYQRYIST